MSDQVTAPKTLEQRLSEKIAEQIGEIMTAEDVRAIVERGVEAAVFQPRRVERQYGGYETKRPLIDELIDQHISEKVRAGVDAWLKQNPEKIQAAVDNAITLGVGGCVVKVLDDRMGEIFRYAIGNMQNQGLLPRP